MEIHSKSKCQSPIPQTMTNDKVQMPNQAQNPNDKNERITITCPHPSPLQQVERGVRRGRGKQESRSRDERLHIAGFCDDAALKLKRTLNGKSSMLLCHHKPFCGKACQILRGRSYRGMQYRESRSGDATGSRNTWLDAHPHDVCPW